MTYLKYNFKKLFKNGFIMGIIKKDDVDFQFQFIQKLTN